MQVAMTVNAHAPNPQLRHAPAPATQAPYRSLLAAALCTCVATLALGAAPAGAIVATVGGHGYGVTPIRGVSPSSIAGAYRAPSSLGVSPAPGVRPFDEAPNGGGALINNGGPVMKSNTTHVIYWDPNGEFDAVAKGVVNKFFTDVAHDSGRATNVFAVDAQYGAGYSSTYAGEATDGDAYPSSGNCSVPGEADPGPPYTKCLYDSQLQSELSAYITAHSLPTGPTQLYFLLLPHKVVTCYVAGECSNNVFCAYHSYIKPGEANEIIYADIPFSLLDEGAAKSCQYDGHSQLQAPNGDTAGTDASTRFADVAVKYISHEYSEAITDPLVGYHTAWTDEKGLENGDKCNAWNVGPGSASGEDKHAFLPTLGGSASAGTLFDQSINADHYYLQSEWDNATLACLMQPALTATFNPSPAPAHVNAPVSLNTNTVDPYGELTLKWNFGDSITGTGLSPSHAYAAPGIYTVTMTATDTVTGTMQPVSHNVVVNDVPSASFSASPNPATAAAAVSFNGVASSDPDGSIASYAWDFGDGASASGATPSHAYAAPGAYTVKLTVTDVAGETSSVSHQVEVSPAGGAANSEEAGAGSGKAIETQGAGGGTGATTGAGTTGAGASAAAGPGNGHFTMLANASVNARTGAITYRLALGDPGTVRLVLRFKNGRFGVFSVTNTRCKPGQVRLKGRCAPAQVLFAQTSRTVAAPGAVTLTLRPSAAAAKALKNALQVNAGLPVTATVSFQPSLGGSATAQTQSLSVKLARARPRHATRG